MKYILIIDQCPDDYQDSDVEQNLKSITQDDALRESLEILKSGDYQPYSSEYSDGINNIVTGDLCKKDENNDLVVLREITVTFGPFSQRPVEEIKVNIP